MAANKQPKRIANFAQAATYTLVFIAILAAVNFLANRYNSSYDSTANKRFTLSEQTQQIAENLDQDLTISYWDRPTYFPVAEELLGRYALLSPSVHVEYNDIDRERTRAIEEGVAAPGQIFLRVGNRTEEAGGLTEQEITGAMVRAVQGGDRVVCFATGYGEASADNSEPNGYSIAKQVTEANNYRTMTVPLLPTPVIPADCTILVVAGPQRNYLEPAVTAIRDYVETGGRALIMLDPPLEFGSQVDDNQGLVALLGDWGVTMNRDLVLDLSGVGQLFGLGPQFPIITNYMRHAIVDQMGDLAVGLPITRSMVPENTAKTEVEPLLETTQDAVATTDLSTSEIELDKGQPGPRVLAVAGTYTVDSPETGDELDASEETSDRQVAGNGHFVVVGTSRWASNGFLEFNGNRDLYLNMLNWLSSDENLIAIRPKDPEDRRLNMNQAQVALLFYGSVVFLPLLMVLAGVSVWWRRR